MELLGYADIDATGKLYRNKWVALVRKEIFYYIVHYERVSKFLCGGFGLDM